MITEYAYACESVLHMHIQVHVLSTNHILTKGRDRLTMGYFDKGFLNKYEKNLKKNYRCVLILLD
jgi:hypothetical protein